jgi:hypothetical protein
MAMLTIPTAKQYKSQKRTNNVGVILVFLSLE